MYLLSRQDETSYQIIQTKKSHFTISNAQIKNISFRMCQPPPVVCRAAAVHVKQFCENIYFVIFDIILSYHSSLSMINYFTKKKKKISADGIT